MKLLKLSILNINFNKFLLGNTSKVCYTSYEQSLTNIKTLLPNSITIKFNIPKTKETFISFASYERPFTIAIATYNFMLNYNLFNKNINYMNVLFYKFNTPKFDIIPLTSFIYLKKHNYLQNSDKKEKFIYIKKLYQNINKIQDKYTENINLKLSRNNFDLNKIYN